MSQSTTFSVVRAEFPSGLSSSSRIHLVSSLSRWCDKYPGRVISNPDSSFIVTDLDGLALGGFTHILECYDCVYSIRLVSRAFFDKLFDSDFARVG